MSHRDITVVLTNPALTLARIAALFARHDIRIESLPTVADCATFTLTRH